MTKNLKLVALAFSCKQNNIKLPFRIQRILCIVYLLLGTLLALSAVDRVNAIEDLCGRSFSITAIGSLTTLTDTAAIKCYTFSSVRLHTSCTSQIGSNIVGFILKRK